MSSVINNDYSIKNYEVNKKERIQKIQGPGIQATVTFTFSSKPNEGSHITIIDAADNQKIFEIDDDADGTSGIGRIAVTGISAAGGGGAGTAIALKNAINAQSGFGVTATTPSSGQIVLTQDIAGEDGNKGISTDNPLHWDTTTSVNIPVSFTGGANGTTANGSALVAPFRVSVNGAPTIRLQSTSNHYQTFIGEDRL